MKLLLLMITGMIAYTNAACPEMPGCDSCTNPPPACQECDAGTWPKDDPVNTCEKCTDNCHTCDSATKCKECDGTYMLKDDQTCEKCGTDCTKCAMTDGNNVCTQCASGTVLLSGKCEKCPTNCETCSSKTTCSKCKTNYIVNTGATVAAGQECLSCPTSCTACEGTELTGLAKCTACKPERWLNNGVCDTCTDTQCKECKEDGTTCTVDQCKTSFYNLATATTCAACPTNCDTCSKTGTDPEVCSECATMFGTKKDTTCDACTPTNCDTCTSSGTTCSDCSTGYYKAADGSCTACTLTNCNDCSSATQCTTCAATHNLVGGSCISCSIGCATCTDGSTCTACSAGYVLASSACTACSSDCTTCTDGSTCTACAAEFFLASAACTACSAGCTTCSDASTCTECKSAFFLASSACTACSSDCLTCSDASTCTECASTHFLASAACTACSSITDCIACTSATACTACSGTKTPDLDGASCIDCPANCDVAGGGCSASATAGTAKCTKCAAAFGVDGESCAACPTGCDTCTKISGKMVCDTCSATKWLKQGTTHFCADCPSNCASCTESSDGTMECEACNSGYALDGNTCKKCPTKCTECSSSSSGVTCKSGKCEMGYGLSDDKASCPNCETLTKVAKCATCEDSNGNGTAVCLSCSSGFFIQDDGKKCLEKYVGCSKSVDTAVQCDTCANGYNISTEKKCFIKCFACGNIASPKGTEAECNDDKFGTEEVCYGTCRSVWTKKGEASPTVDRGCSISDCNSNEKDNSHCSSVDETKACASCCAGDNCNNGKFDANGGLDSAAGTTTYNILLLVGVIALLLH